MLDTYLQRLKNQTLYTNVAASGQITSITTTVTSNDTVPIDVDESYELYVLSSTISITATTVFGAFHAYETLMQLIEFDEDNEEYSVWAYTIGDEPRYGWRGLLIDTARHWLPLSAIRRQIIALAAAKMNVLHWHICDAQSFPWKLDSDELLAEGAYGPSYVYTSEDLAELVEFGRSWGVFVLLELDMPGHAASWGVGHPGITANCPSYEHNINNIPLDPSNNETFDVIATVLAEALDLTYSRYVHVGGDEVVDGCWEEDEDIAAFMADMGLSADELWQYFTEKLNGIVPADASPIFWQDTFDNGGPLRDDAIVEAWRDQEELGAIVKAGYRGILAGGFYLDQQVPGASTHYAFYSTWEDFFNNEPTAGLDLTAEEEALIMGGEAAMWAEGVDESAMDTFIWPRSLAIAERLWVDKDVTDEDAAELRIQSHRCRLVRRGVGAGPVGPSEPCPGEYVRWSWDPVL